MKRSGTLSTVLIALGLYQGLYGAQPAPHILPIDLLAPYSKVEYLRGTAQLIHLKVIDQFDVTDEEQKKGCTEASCFYHALRNCIIVGQAIHDQLNAKSHLEKLFDRKDLCNKLGFRAPWRSEIVKLRKGTDTDMVEAQEAQRLIEYVSKKQHIFPKGTVDFAIYEAVSNGSLTNSELPGMRKLKTKYSKQQNFTGFIFVYSDEHDNEKALAELATLSNKERAERLRNAVGHWIGLIVNKVGTERTYILVDSVRESAPFATSITIKRLLDYLEGDSAPFLRLPKVHFIDETSVQPVSDKGMVPSLSIEGTKPKASRKNKKEASSWKGAALYSIISGVVLYSLWHYFQKEKSDSSQKSIPQIAA